MLLSRVVVTWCCHVHCFHVLLSGAVVTWWEPYYSLLQFANELMGQCVLAHTLGEIPCHAFPCRAGAKVCLLEAAIVSIESYRAGRGVILYNRHSIGRNICQAG